MNPPQLLLCANYIFKFNTRDNQSITYHSVIGFDSKGSMILIVFRRYLLLNAGVFNPSSLFYTQVRKVNYTRFTNQSEFQTEPRVS